MSNLGFHTDSTEIISHQHLHLPNFTVSTITNLQVSRYFFPIGLLWMLLFIINQAHSFWIKGRLVHLHYAINTYSKNKIPHRPQSENYEIHFSLKTSGTGILQYTESISLPKSIKSCEWNVQANNIYGFK